MKYIYIFIVLFFASCAHVTGVVTYPNAVPAKGANVSLDCGNRAVKASASGRFSVRVWTNQKVCTVRAWEPGKIDSAAVKLVILKGKGKLPANITLPR